MLWLCLFFPRLPIELRQPFDQGAVAITDRAASRRFLVACNQAASGKGLTPGLDAALALAREPELRLIERSRPQEVEALQGLATWADEFSNEVCSDAERWLLWLEVGAGLGYFGGLENLLGRIGSGLEVLSYSAASGVAPTMEAAALLACQGISSPILDRGGMAEALSPLPLFALALSPRILDSLAASGLKSIGEVLALPRAALARRFDHQVTDYLQRLLGECPDVRPRHRIPPTWHRRCDFAEPVVTSEALLFPLKRLLQEFQGYLRGRDTAIQELLILLKYRGRTATSIAVRTTDPQRDAEALFILVREHLERIQLPAPVEQMLLSADRFVMPIDRQRTLFESQRQKDADWMALLDKLRARLGEQAVRQLGLGDDHRPEKAWRTEDVGQQQVLPAPYPERPLWIFEPTPLKSLPKLLGRPERIEAGWWEGMDSSRDYYLAETSAGVRCWVFRDAATRRWFLHGLWA
jgi:protein ImuB